MEIEKLDNEYMIGCYKKKVGFDKGKGSYIFDLEGKKYLDLVGGIATCSVGHANKRLVKVIKKQSKKIINVSNLFYSIPQVELAEKLIEISGLNACFFCNSGTEAVEAAIKLAKKNTGKKKIISMKKGFHGRTMGSLSATWNSKYKENFMPLLEGFVHVDYDDIEALENVIDDSAAVIIEPIQGEGGVIVPSSDYLEKVSLLCKKKNCLMIIDEIQTGNGRSGKFFCYQNFNVEPDIVCVAKGLANGLPIGAVIAKEGIDFSPGDHGSTFGGNSFCCAVALETISIIDELNVKEKGDYFISELKKIKSDKIIEVRGMGLMIAIEVKEKGSLILDKCYEKGLVVNCIQDKIIRLLPPLTISKKEIDSALEILKEVLQ